MGKPTIITSAIILFYAYKYMQHPGVFAPWPAETLPKIKFAPENCHPAPGFENFGELPGAEDLERSGDSIFVSVGLRYDLFAKTLPPTKWQGVFVYNRLNPEKEPVKIGLSRANPHGLSLFRIGEGLVRVFVVSHAVITAAEVSGREEIIVFDFDEERGEKVNEFRVAHESIISVNDVKAIGSDRFLITNDFLIKNVILKKLSMYLLLPFGNVVDITLDKNMQVGTS